LTSCRSPYRGASASRLRCRSRTAVSTATPSDRTTHADRAPCRSCCCCTTGAHSCLVAPAVAAMPVSACSPHPPEPSRLLACRYACSSHAASNPAFTRSHSRCTRVGPRRRRHPPHCGCLAAAAPPRGDGVSRLPRCGYLPRSYCCHFYHATIPSRKSLYQLDATIRAGSIISRTLGQARK